MRSLGILLVAGLLGCASSPPASTPMPKTNDHDAHAMHGDHAMHDHHAMHGEHAGHQGGMHKSFDNAEEWTKVFDDPARDEWQQPDRVIGALALAPAMTVADVGAGTGYFAVRLARAVPKGSVIATDIEVDMVRFMADRAKREGLANLKAQATPPDDPQLGAAALDRILVVDVWHHLGDRKAFAKKLAQALRPGGFVAVVDFKLDATRGPPAEFRLAPEAIAADLAAAGLATEVSSVALPDQYIVIAKR